MFRLSFHERGSPSRGHSRDVLTCWDVCLSVESWNIMTGCLATNADEDARDSIWDDIGAAKSFIAS